MEVTKEWIFENRTPRGAWTKKQLALIGVPWPPPEGWPTRAVGTVISDQTARDFEAAGAAGKPLRKGKGWHPKRGPVCVCSHYWTRTRKIGGPWSPWEEIDEVCPLHWEETR
jgi:hypothetical protein